MQTNWVINSNLVKDKKKKKTHNLNLNIQEKKKLVVEELFVILAVHECEGVF
jgi:hypothetical protein